MGEVWGLWKGQADGLVCRIDSRGVVVKGSCWGGAEKVSKGLKSVHRLVVGMKLIARVVRGKKVAVSRGKRENYQRTRL